MSNFDYKDSVWDRVRATTRVSTISNGVKGVGEKIASKEVYTAILIILVGFASFGLGRLSKLQESRVPVRIESTAQTASVASSVDKTETSLIAEGGKLVASKNGAKYHFPWCGGAQRISPKNLISFNSVEEARKAGYTPAANCKGLK